MNQTTRETALEPVILVIFGITGDLAQRKLLPALYHLLKDGLLPEGTVILGVSRRSVTAEELLGQVELCVNEIDKVCDPEGLRRVRQALRMHQMSLTDGAEYDELLKVLNDIEAQKGVCMNRLYNLSIPPAMIEPIVRNLGRHGHNKSCEHGNASTRLLIEKPFGYDVPSAEALIAETGEWFSEEQLFRIDHYVAKETVQNILTFRLFNPIFSTIWNHEHICSVDITAFEQITIEGRTVFYEGVGALRDFVQSHLLQLLAVLAMEPPKDQSSEAVHAAKLRLLQSIVPIQPNEVNELTVRGQYDGYRQEVGNDRTLTETYASLTLHVDNERWQGVPMTVRTGKAMARKFTEIRLTFASDGEKDNVAPNELIFHIQPSEGISLRLNAKKPGFAKELQSVIMDFNYQQSFRGGVPATPSHPDAYERVLVDAVRGDHTLFTTSDEVMAAWRIVENVLTTWSKSDDGLILYSKGAENIS